MYHEYNCFEIVVRTKKLSLYASSLIYIVIFENTIGKTEKKYL